MLIDNDFFEHSIVKQYQSSPTCPKCIETPDYPENDHGDCNVCLQKAYDWNYIESYVFIQNIDNIINVLSTNELYYIITDFKRTEYECYECSSIEDDQYHCTTCENQTITEFDYILFQLTEQNKMKAVNLLNNIIEE